MKARVGGLVVIIAMAALLASCQSPTNAPGNYGSISGRVTTLDPPGTITSSFALAVNAAGQVMGGYVDSNSIEHGFLWSPDGTYTITTVPVTDALSPDVVTVTSVPSGFAVPAPRTNVQVTAGQTTTGINFTLAPL